MKYQKGQLVKNLVTGGFHLVAGYVVNPLNSCSGEVIVYTGTKESLKLHFLPCGHCELISNNYRSKNGQL